jgi:uncharacterized protein YraI
VESAQWGHRYLNSLEVRDTLRSDSGFAKEVLMRQLSWVIPRFVCCAVLIVFFASVTFAQKATVARPVNLRVNPSTSNSPISVLATGTALTLLDSTPQTGYYHVKTEDGTEGWVWARNVKTGGVQFSESSASTECDDSLWDHVYNPQRLIVKQKCAEVTGTIVDATNKKRSDGVRHEAGGDTHGWLDLDPQFKILLNAGNMSAENGNMVFEIVCKFPVTQADAKSACPASFHNAVKIPPVGSHVKIIGTYVQDTEHAKWMEIHPVTSITVIQ